MVTIDGVGFVVPAEAAEGACFEGFDDFDLFVGEHLFFLIGFGEFIKELCDDGEALGEPEVFECFVHFF